MRAHQRTRLLAVAAAATGLVAGVSAFAANGTKLETQLGTLKTGESRAILDLYAADAALSRATARVAQLERTTAAARSRLETAQTVLAVGTKNLEIARNALTERVAAAYRTGDVDPLTIVLSAGSLSDAIDRLSIVRRVTAEDARILREVGSGVAATRAAARRLAAARADVQVALATARSEAASLQGARDAAAAILADLRTREHLTRDRINRLAAAAARSEATAGRLTREASTGSDTGSGSGSGTTTGGGTVRPVGSGQTLSVLATAYAINGHTATGIPTQRGVCATDPAVIPLGTRFTVPGYGDCIAADTGGAVRGARIDVWVASEREALAWGMRTVTITIR